jgi:hypothetical protein
MNTFTHACALPVAAPWQSAPGRYLIDTTITQGRGHIPTPIEGAPYLALRRAERALHEAAAIQPIELTGDDGFPDTVILSEPPHGSGWEPEGGEYIAPGWRASLLFTGTAALAFVGFVGSIWLAVRHWG